MSQNDSGGPPATDKATFAARTANDERILVALDPERNPDELPVYNDKATGTPYVARPDGRLVPLSEVERLAAEFGIQLKWAIPLWRPSQAT